MPGFHDQPGPEKDREARFVHIRRSRQAGMRLAAYHARRRIFALLQAVLMLGLPFMRISGESALRFDAPSLKLYFFGSVIWISESYFFLLVFLLFFLGITLFTVIYGRIWCGWMCPQTVLSRVARSAEKLAAWLIHHRVLRLSRRGHGLGRSLDVLVMGFYLNDDLCQPCVRASEVLCFGLSLGTLPNRFS